MPPAYTNAERETLFETIQRLIREDQLSLRKACERLGVPPGTYKLWEKKAAADGSLADARRENSGRTAAITLTDEETLALQQHYLAKECSFATAVEFFLTDTRCQESTRAFIRARLKEARAAGTAPNWPVSLRRAATLAHGTVAHYQGPKAVQSAHPKGRYSHEIEIDGRRYPLLPGFAWTFDDYSANENYILRYADGRERLCRQVLLGMDIGDRRWLGAYHVGKERDAYTAADVLEVFRLTMEGQGHVPRVLVLEQGRWKGNAVVGIEIADGRHWGSITEAGIILKYTFKSQGKTEIENGIDLLQTWTAGEAAGIGRFRGIMERETKNMLAINSAKDSSKARDAKLCGFLETHESAQLHYEMFLALNDRPKHFRELARHVSANQLLAENPFTPRPLDPAHRWLFYPQKFTATVRDNGFIQRTVEGREFVFHINGVSPDVHLPNGYSLLVAFDPTRPELGAHIANNETGSINRDHWRLGQTLLTAAPPLEAAPRLSIRTSAAAADPLDETASWKARKGAVRAAQTHFAAVLPGGKRGLRATRRQTRAGDLTEIIHQGDSPLPETPAAATPASASQTINPRLPRPPKQRLSDEIHLTTAPPRQTRLKTPANTAPDPTDDEDLAAMEAALLAGH